MKYGANLMPFAVSPLITKTLTRSRENWIRDCKISEGTAAKFTQANTIGWLCFYRLSYKFMVGRKETHLRSYDPEFVDSARSYEQ